MSIILLLGIILFFTCAYLIMHNSLIKACALVDEANNRLKINMKKRSDLTSQLLTTFATYFVEEPELLATLTNARDDVITHSTGELFKWVESDGNLGNKLQLVAPLYNIYPGLKENQHFSNSLNELLDTEKKIVYSQHLYNQIVVHYNLKVRSFPSNIVAKINHFTEKSAIIIPEKIEAQKTATDILFY